MYEEYWICGGYCDIGTKSKELIAIHMLISDCFPIPFTSPVNCISVSSEKCSKLCFIDSVYFSLRFRCLIVSSVLLFLKSSNNVRVLMPVNYATWLMVRILISSLNL